MIIRARVRLPPCQNHGCVSNVLNACPSEISDMSRPSNNEVHIGVCPSCVKSTRAIQGCTSDIFLAELWIGKRCAYLSSPTNCKVLMMKVVWTYSCGLCRHSPVAFAQGHPVPSLGSQFSAAQHIVVFCVGCVRAGAPDHSFLQPSSLVASAQGHLLPPSMG